MSEKAIAAGQKKTFRFGPAVDLDRIPASTPLSATEKPCFARKNQHCCG